ncbi:MAG: 2,3-bisphosphoglycerate-independent phosphoglycerate mutase [Solirubrobacteraceae bacterium]
MTAPNGVCLIVLDGWGIAPPGPGNAISLARTPNFDDLWQRFPHTELAACGRAVGLPDGQMGNSEVGHLNLGAGAIVRQDLSRIDDAIAAGSLAHNEVLRAAFAGPGRVHLLGLVSDGGVHSSLDHLEALIALGGEDRVIVHAWTDGRDTLPTAGAGFVARIECLARVGSVMGRYWAMDRDSRWDRVQRAYDLLVHARGEFQASSGAAAVRSAYARGETDEFIAPTLVGGKDSAIASGDSVLCFNFRPDRMREIVRALADPAFDAVDRGDALALRRLTTLTEYEEGWPHPIAFAPERPVTTLSRVIARSGAPQLHVAETEKYPHVTYFFNGGEERALPGERRELVPSPRDVATYDERPEMSAHAAASAFCGAWQEDSPRFGIINFANADMVGHTGVIAAAIDAVETVDACLGEVVSVVLAGAGECIICADHGNSDHMLEPDGSPNTAHSLNPVPLIVTRAGVRLRGGGALADVAPTVLSMLEIEQPPAMSGRSLIAR